MQSQNKKGFTLVELIVVITILAILGAIAFISLQGFSADARDSARASDLKNIQTKISTSASTGISYDKMVGTTSNALSNISVGGVTPAATEYDAGSVNFTILGMKAEDFKDPKSGDDYVIGSTTKAGGAFELAATKEANSGTALVIGNYKSRATTDTASISDTSATLTTAWGSIKITDGMGIFQIGDVVNINDWTNTNEWKISGISADKTTITVVDSDTTDNTPLWAFASGEIALAADESTGLIASTDDATVEVTNGSTTALPYSF